MYQELLTQAGLSPNQAEIYEILVKNGALPAGKVAKNTTIKRGLVYKVLGELVELAIIEETKEPGKVAHFTPAHPSCLNNLIENKQKEAKQAQSVLEGLLPSLISDFSIISGKPGVRVYEGDEGLKKIVEDSLTAKGQIDTFVDNEAVNKYYKEVNAYVIEQRSKLGIKKRMITIDTPYIYERAKSLNPENSEVRVLTDMDQPFATVVQIYNDKVSYITLDPKTRVGIIIENPFIARMHKTIFEYVWKNSKSIPLGAQIPKPAPKRPAALMLD